MYVNARLIGVKVSEILRLIGRDGWYLDRQKGSHRQYKHPSKRGLVTVSGSQATIFTPRRETVSEAGWVERRRKPS
jgi:predicted RNA binding protein YcfA (HicA-like mRNA interferase family)